MEREETNMTLKLQKLRQENAVLEESVEQWQEQLAKAAPGRRAELRLLEDQLKAAKGEAEQWYSKWKQT